MEAIKEEELDRIIREKGQKKNHNEKNKNNPQ